MSEPLFDPDECSLPSLPIVDFDFIEDCEVLPAPDPVFSCPDVDIPIEFPTTVVPCPIITATGDIALDAPGSEPGLEVVVTSIPSPETSACAAHIDFSFTLPRPACPVISVSGSIEAVPANEEPGVEIVVTQVSESSSSACLAHFDFAFTLPEVPCPVITIDATVEIVASDEEPGVEVVITPIHESSISCASHIDFSFTLPKIPCPTVTVDGTVEINNAAEPSVEIVVTPVPESETSECVSHIDFTFVLPTVACPTLTASGTIEIDDIEEPGVEIVITPTPGEASECAAHIDFTFTLPTIPCPTFNSSATSNLGDVNVTFTPQELGGTSCGFDVDFDFDFEVPEIACPAFEATGNVELISDVEPTVDITITKTGVTILPGGVSQCEYSFDFNFTLPSTGGGGSTGGGDSEDDQGSAIVTVMSEEPNGDCMWDGQVASVGTTSGYCSDQFPASENCWIVLLNTEGGSTSVNKATLEIGQHYVGQKVGEIAEVPIYAIRVETALARFISFRLNQQLKTEHSVTSSDCEVLSFWDGGDPDPEEEGIGIQNTETDYDNVFKFSGDANAIGFATWNPKLGGYQICALEGDGRRWILWKNTSAETCPALGCFYNTDVVLDDNDHDNTRVILRGIKPSTTFYDNFWINGYADVPAGGIGVCSSTESPVEALVDRTDTALADRCYGPKPGEWALHWQYPGVRPIGVTGEDTLLVRQIPIVELLGKTTSSAAPEYSVVYRIMVGDPYDEEDGGWTSVPYATTRTGLISDIFIRVWRTCNGWAAEPLECPP